MRRFRRARDSEQELHRCWWRPSLVLRSHDTGPPVIGELRELARAHAPEAIKELARLAVKAKSESARISAIRELLDRGFGKPTQFLAGDSEIIPKDTTLEQFA